MHGSRYSQRSPEGWYVSDAALNPPCDNCHLPCFFAAFHVISSVIIRFYVPARLIRW